MQEEDLEAMSEFASGFCVSDLFKTEEVAVPSSSQTSQAQPPPHDVSMTISDEQQTKQAQIHQELSNAFTETRRQFVTPFETFSFSLDDQPFPPLRTDKDIRQSAHFSEDLLCKFKESGEIPSFAKLYTAWELPTAQVANRFLNYLYRPSVLDRQQLPPPQKTKTTFGQSWHFVKQETTREFHCDGDRMFVSRLGDCSSKVFHIRSTVLSTPSSRVLTKLVFQDMPFTVDQVPNIKRIEFIESHCFRHVQYPALELVLSCKWFADMATIRGRDLLQRDFFAALEQEQQQEEQQQQHHQHQQQQQQQQQQAQNSETPNRKGRKKKPQTQKLLHQVCHSKHPTVAQTQLAHNLALKLCQDLYDDRLKAGPSSWTCEMGVCLVPERFLIQHEAFDKTFPTELPPALTDEMLRMFADIEDKIPDLLLRHGHLYQIPTTTPLAPASSSSSSTAIMFSHIPPQMSFPACVFYNIFNILLSRIVDHDVRRSVVLYVSIAARKRLDRENHDLHMRNKPHTSILTSCPEHGHIPRGAWVAFSFVSSQNGTAPMAHYKETLHIDR